MKTVVQISALDEATVQLSSNDRGALMELSEHFTFYAEGYRFMPAYRNKTWDGKIRIYDSRRNTLPYGLLPEAVKFLSSRGYGVSCDDTLKCRKRPSAQSIKEYIAGMSIRSRGNEISHRDYQISAITHALTSGRGLILSPTGSGKSLIIYTLARWFMANRDESIIIIAPTTSLVEQMASDFIDYSSDDNEFSAEDIHVIYSGKERENINSRIVITTWQSAIKMQKPWFKKYGMVIGDEAHLFKAKSLNDIMTRCSHAYYRFGTSGTLDGSLCNERVLIGNFGPIYQTTRTRDLIENKTLADLHIYCKVLKHTDEERKIVSKFDYQTEISAIAAHDKRNAYIKDLALSLYGNTLVLFNLVQKHGKPLYKSICEMSDSDRAVYYVSGEVDAKTRESIRGLTENEGDYTIFKYDDGSSHKIFTSHVSENFDHGGKTVTETKRTHGAIIVASSQTFATGINIRNLHNIIFAAPSKSQIRVLQSIGRGLRRADDGVSTSVYDISDDFSWKKKKNYTLQHAIHRVDIYKREGFKFELQEIDMS